MSPGPILFLLSFATFASFSAPGLYLRDSGELTTAAYTLGVAHETGFSLYCLLGKAISFVPLGEIATRLNFLSALTGALSSWLIYRVAVEVGGGDRASKVGGVVAAALLPCGLTFFRASTVAEVYAPTSCAIAAALFLIVRLEKKRPEAGLLLALLGGLSLGLHAHFRLLIGPPLILYAIYRLRRHDRWPLLAPALVALGAAVVFYLPIRALHNPADNWGDPRTLGALMDHLTAARIRHAFSAEMMSTDLLRVAHELRRFLSATEGQLGILAILAAFGGVAVLFRASSLLFVSTLFLVVGDLIYAVWLNPMGIADLQDGAPTAIGIALLAGLGVMGLSRFVERVGGEESVSEASRPFRRAGPWMAGALGAALVVPAVLTDLDAKQGLGSQASQFTLAALLPPPPRSLLLITSDDLAAGSLYEQAVGGVRPDLTVLVRQQLAERSLYRREIARAGGEVRALDLWSDSPASWRRHEPELLATLVRHELVRRSVYWEPGGEPPPAGTIEPGVPLYTLTPDSPSMASTALKSEPLRPMVDRLERLLTDRPGLSPRDPIARDLECANVNSLGRFYLQRNDELSAAALFDTARVLCPRDAAAAVNLAVVLARRGEFDRALELVQVALSLDPMRSLARLNAGRYRLELSDLDGAEREFSFAKRHATWSDPGPLLGLARVAMKRGDRALAFKWIERAQRIDPTSAEARAIKGELSR